MIKMWQWFQACLDPGARQCYQVCLSLLTVLLFSRAGSSHSTSLSPTPWWQDVHHQIQTYTQLSKAYGKGTSFSQQFLKSFMDIGHMSVIESVNVAGVMESSHGLGLVQCPPGVLGPRGGSTYIVSTKTWSSRRTWGANRWRWRNGHWAWRSNRWPLQIRSLP